MKNKTASSAAIKMRAENIITGLWDFFFIRVPDEIVACEGKFAARVLSVANVFKRDSNAES